MILANFVTKISRRKEKNYSRRRPTSARPLVACVACVPCAPVRSVKGQINMANVVCRRFSETGSGIPECGLNLTIIFIFAAI
jgi:hypothetical protein